MSAILNYLGFLQPYLVFQIRKKMENDGLAIIIAMIMMLQPSSKPLALGRSVSLSEYMVSSRVITSLRFALQRITLAAVPAPGQEGSWFRL
jgi:hypothetical protein